MAGDDDMTVLRHEMVQEVINIMDQLSKDQALSQLDARVLAVMRAVPRHEFVPDDFKPLAYSNRPLAIGYGQTISQPLIVALMSALLDPRPGTKVLEVGTGSGYQTAILASLVEHVFSIEIVEELSLRATETLGRLGITNVTLKVGDGHAGWPEFQPFDGILVAAAAKSIPSELSAQLAAGGRLVMPVGSPAQYLKLLAKRDDGNLVESEILPVRFVPLTGANSRDV